MKLHDREKVGTSAIVDQLGTTEACQVLGLKARARAYFLMLLTRSAAAGSFIRSRNSAKERGAVCSAKRVSSAISLLRKCDPAQVLKNCAQQCLSSP